MIYDGSGVPDQYIFGPVIGMGVDSPTGGNEYPEVERKVRMAKFYRHLSQQSFPIPSFRFMIPEPAV